MPIDNALFGFFQELYSSSHPLFPEDLDGLSQPCISNDDNAALCAVPSSLEIFVVVKK